MTFPPRGLRKGPVSVSADDRLSSAYRVFLRELGVPPAEWDDPGLDLGNTPKRIAKALRDELLSSYKPAAEQELIARFTTFSSDGRDALVTSGPFSYYSLCAHHILPFYGECYVGYLPGERLVGASKIPRVIDHYSRMLQIQERLARQVAAFIHDQAGAQWVGVIMRGSHMCMQCRGVKQAGASMLTTSVCPKPEGPDDQRALIDEFYRQVAMLRKE